MSGYIFLHRVFDSWAWRKDPSAVSIFIHLLQRAEWEDREYRKTKVPRGSLCTSRAAIASHCGLSKGVVDRVLADLTYSGELVTNPTTKYTMISITNYDKYQNPKHQPGNEEGNEEGNDLDTSKKKRNKEIKNTSNNVVELGALQKEDRRISDASRPEEMIVIDYFNFKLNRSLKQVKSNYKEIFARLKEGYQLEDFNAVIDYAAGKWVGDEFWDRFVRPSTMFGGKMGSYLDESKRSYATSEDALLKEAVAKFGFDNTGL